MFNWYLLALTVFVAFLFIIVTIRLFLIRKKANLVPTNDKDSKLNNDIITAGFAYSNQYDVFFSRKDALQREYGYCHLYDEAMPMVGMIVDCEPIYFDYNNKHWLIEFWKGQYGLATGAQIGVFNTANGPIKAPGFNGIFYESISDDECFPIEFTLKKNNKALIHRSEVQWWLTGLKLGEFSTTSSLSLNIKLVFPNKNMCCAFVTGLINAGYSNHEFSSHFRTVTIHFTKPHTTQPASRTRVQEAIIQQGNETNCRMYDSLTCSYNNTLDKLELLKSSSPDLYVKLLKSIYSKELYTSFELISPILKKFNATEQFKKIDDPFSESIDI